MIAATPGKGQTRPQGGVVGVKAEADDVYGLPDKGDRDLDASQVVQTDGVGGCCGAVLSAHLVVVGQGPQLHTLRFGAFCQGFRGEGAVRNHRMAVQVSVENRCHRRILGRLARACWLLDQL